MLATIQLHTNLSSGSAPLHKGFVGHIAEFFARFLAKYSVDKL